MRLFVVTITCAVAFAAAAWAQGEPAAPQPGVLTNVYACRAIADDSARLACFDAAVGSLQAAQESGQVVTVDRDRIREVARDSFGFSIPALGRLLPSFGGGEGGAEEDIDNVAMVIDRVSERGGGYHTFYMTNGQAWTQVQPERISRIRAGSQVTVRRAAVGSFMLSSPDSRSAHRVRRVE